MSDALFCEIQKTHGTEISEAFLRAYCEGLEQKTVFDSVGWMFLQLFAQDFPMSLRQELIDRANAQLPKPYGCELCGDKEATKYHPYVGRVCTDCHSTLPQE